MMPRCARFKRTKGYKLALAAHALQMAGSADIAVDHHANIMRGFDDSPARVRDTHAHRQQLQHINMALDMTNVWDNC